MRQSGRVLSLLLFFTACQDSDFPTEWLFEPGYKPGTAEECEKLRAALFDDSATIVASVSAATFSDPRLPLEVGLTERLAVFLERQCYKLPGWAGEDGVHFTGELNVASTHGWGRVYYSPEVLTWLNNGRKEGQVPEQALIIKERFEPIGVAKEEGGVFKLAAWQPMVRRFKDVQDGWFWGEIAQEEARHGEIRCSLPPISWGTSASLHLDDCRPPSSFSQPCLRCHGSQRDFTFSQTTHLPENTGGMHAQSQTIYDYRRVWRDVDAQNPDNRYDDYKNLSATTFIANHPDRQTIAPALGRAFPEFVAQYGLPADETAPYADLPRFFDHVFPMGGRTGPDASATFVTSDQCWGCHSGVAHVVQGLDSPGSMTVQDGTLASGDPRYADVSPWGEWSVSMMGLAGRDPIFRAQREWEANHRAACADDITDLCYKCHGAAGQHQLKIESPGRKFEHAMVSALPGTHDGKYGGLARDGITCAVCHQISGNALGTPPNYTGNFTPASADDLFGPYSDNVQSDPMRRTLGKTPSGDNGRDAVTRSAALCGSCHAVRLPVRKVGSCIDERFGYEQATFLEWRDSDYRKNDDFIHDEGHDGATPQTCQDCHMPRRFGTIDLRQKIASIEDTDFPTINLKGVPDLHKGVALLPRTPFARHQLNGINLFALSMFAQAPRVFGLADYDYQSNQYGEPTRLQMATALASGQALAGGTATLDIGTPLQTASELEFTITVKNQAGHKLPSGVAFRRAFLEVAVEDASGTTLWASGRTNAAGAILDGAGQILASEFATLAPEPHHQTISSESEVQIYEERVTDSDNKLTTSFLSIETSVKDNRLLPRGWKSGFVPTMEGGVVPDGLEPHGTSGDPEYPLNGSPACGCDIIAFKVPLAAVATHAQVRARLHYQAIPPYYLRDRFSVAFPDATRLYQITSHLNTGPDSAIPGWKLKLTEATRATK